MSEPSEPRTPDRRLTGTVGLWTRDPGRAVDDAAGASPRAVVVAHGHGGHHTGWLGARLCVRSVIDRFGGEPSATVLLGAADGILPDDPRWPAATHERSEAGYSWAASSYSACITALDTECPNPVDLAALLSAVDRVPSKLHNRPNLATSCIAVQLDGRTVRGAHVGAGRALLLRGSGGIETLVAPQFLPVVGHRKVIGNLIGQLTHACASGVESFEVEVDEDDQVFLCAIDLEIPDDEIAQLLRCSVSGRPLQTLFPTIEQRCSEIFAEQKRARVYGYGDRAFALIRG